jgi:hypothetical protein
MQLAPRSLYMFDEASRLRQAVLKIILWKWFDRFILTVIIVNSIFLALTDYSITAVDPRTLNPDPDRSWRNLVVSRSELYFTIIFAMEAVLKIVGMGFMFDEGSYLQDKWNWSVHLVVVRTACGLVVHCFFTFSFAYSYARCGVTGKTGLTSASSSRAF